MFRSPTNAATRLRKETCDPPSKVKPTRKALLRLLSIARPYWWQLGLLMGAAFFSSTLGLSLSSS